MIVAALDIGQTTGVGVAEIFTQKLPSLMLLKPIDLRDRSQVSIHVEFNRLFATFTEMEVELLVVEWPANDKFSSQSKQTTAIAQEWRYFVESILNKGTGKYMDIQPGTWKSTPAGDVKQFSSNQEMFFKKPIMKPSKHEEDAARILYWVAMFGKAVR